MVQKLTFVSLVASEPTHYRRHREADWRKRQPKNSRSYGFPGSSPGTIEAFLLDMEAKTHVIVFDPGAETMARLQIIRNRGDEPSTDG